MNASMLLLYGYVIFESGIELTPAVHQDEVLVRNFVFVFVFDVDGREPRVGCMSSGF